MARIQQQNNNREQGYYYFVNVSCCCSVNNGKWEVKEVSTPQVGTNQVLLKIHASGICYTYVHITKGGLGVKFPHTIGHEPAGEIVEIGEGANNTESRR